MAALQRYIVGDVDGTEHFGSEALSRGEQVGDPTARSLGLLALAYAASMRGELELGRERIEETMRLAIGGEVHRLYAGMVACGVVELCRILGDWDAANEWNEVAVRFNERESLCHYPGHCSVYRSEVERHRGNFEAAAASAFGALKEAGDWSHGECGSHRFERYHASAPDDDPLTRLESLGAGTLFYFPGW